MSKLMFFTFLWSVCSCCCTLEMFYFFRISSGFNIPTTAYNNNNSSCSSKILYRTHTLTHQFTNTHTHDSRFAPTHAINFYGLYDLPEIKMYELCVGEYPYKQHTHIIAMLTHRCNTLTHTHTERGKNTHKMAMIRCFMNCHGPRIYEIKGENAFKPFMHWLSACCRSWQAIQMLHLFRAYDCEWGKHFNHITS